MLESKPDKEEMARVTFNVDESRVVSGIIPKKIVDLIENGNAYAEAVTNREEKIHTINVYKKLDNQLIFSQDIKSISDDLHVVGGEKINLKTEAIPIAGVDSLEKSKKEDKIH